MGWVADFRDEWSTNPYLEKRYPTDWHRRLNRRLETSVLREASAVVCGSGPWPDTLGGLVPEQPVSKFEVHPNGYDPWPFRGKDPGAPTVFRVAYTGTFYGHRSPRAFMQGVVRAIQNGRIPADAIEVVLVGHSEPAMMKDVIPTARVRALDHRPFHETIRLLRDAAVLLLVIPTEGGPGNHTGKLFNYLAARRPILALSPEPNVPESACLKSAAAEEWEQLCSLKNFSLR